MFFLPNCFRVRVVVFIFASFGWVNAELPVSDGLKLWLRSDQGVIEGAGGVQEWRDLSGNGHHFTQEDSGRRPWSSADHFDLYESQLLHLSGELRLFSEFPSQLARDFIVEKEIVVTGFSVADYGHPRQDRVMLNLLRRDDKGTAENGEDDTAGELLETLQFSSSSPGILRGDLRFKEFAAPRILQPGAYTLRSVRIGFPDRSARSFRFSEDPDATGVRVLPWLRRKSWGNDLPPVGGEPWEGLFQGDFSMTFHSRSPKDAAAQTAIGFNGRDDGLKAPKSFFLGRPSTVFVVFQRDSDEASLLLESDNGNTDFLTTGYDLPGSWTPDPLGKSQQPVIAELTYSPDGTSWGFDGEDLTMYPDYKDTTLGRMSLGHDRGTDWSPDPFRVGEVIVYERVLTEEEKRETQNYLRKRYKQGPIPLPVPQILSRVEAGLDLPLVEIDQPLSRAETYFTLDGSDPNLSSSLYTGPLSVAPGIEVRALSVLPGGQTSGTAARVVPSQEEVGFPQEGLRLWAKADRGVEMDPEGNVSRWQDLTGHGNDFVQRVSEARPQKGLIEIPSQKKRAFEGMAGGTITVMESSDWGALSLVFEVTEDLTITHLGVWDGFRSGFPRSARVELVSVDRMGTPTDSSDDVVSELLETKWFGQRDLGELEEGYWYRALPAPRVLSPGYYALVTQGWSDGFHYRLDPQISIPDDGKFRLVESRRGPSFSPLADDNPLGAMAYGGPGTFKFLEDGNVQEERPCLVFDGIDDGLVQVGQSVADDKPLTLILSGVCEDGKGNLLLVDRLIENGFDPTEFKLSASFIMGRGRDAPHWFHVIIEATENDLRVWHNNEAHWKSGERSDFFGRLILGDDREGFPTPMKITEIMAYDRILSKEERLQVEEYLQLDSLGERRALEPVEIFPPSGAGVEPVQVSLSAVESDVEIRYTLDGRLPDVNSTPYTGSFSVPRGTTVRARSFRGSQSSWVISEQAYLPLEEALPVAGATLWLDANYGVSRSPIDEIHTWRDLSGNGNDFRQESLYIGPRLGQRKTLFGPFETQQAVIFESEDDGLLGPPELDFGKPVTIMVALQENDGFGRVFFQDPDKGSDFNLSSWRLMAGDTIADFRSKESDLVLATIKFGEDGTYFRLNDDDPVSIDSPLSEDWGRVALGAAPGSNQEAIPASFVSMVVFDRVLNHEEELTMRQYLRERATGIAPQPPEISPPSHFGEGEVSVTLSTVVAGAEIRYTLDGSPPLLDSPEYQGPFTVPRGSHLRSRQFFNGLPVGEVSSAFYQSLEERPHPVDDASLWLRADRGLVLDDDDGIWRWLDFSGKGNDFVQETPRKRLCWEAAGIETGDHLLFPYSPNVVGDWTTSSNVGTDFIVEESVVVTALSAFDDGLDGFEGSINVELHRIDDRGTPDRNDDVSEAILASMNFDSSDSGELRDDFRVKELELPMTLEPGRYLIVASGYAEDRLATVQDHVSDYQETRFKGIRFPFEGRLSDSSEPILPGNLKAFRFAYYKAASLVYHLADKVPVSQPAVKIGQDDRSMSAPKDLVFESPSTVLIVFRQQILGSGQQTLISDGTTSSSWPTGLREGPAGGHYAASESSEPRVAASGRLMVMAHVSDEKASRFWLNGIDLNAKPGPLGPIGEIIIGERRFGSGPIGELMELIVFDRKLSDRELTQIQRSLCDEYQVAIAQLPPPSVSREGGLFSGAAEVSMTHPLPEARIHFTTDGSEPNSLSPAYMGPFTLEEDFRIRAIAVADGYCDSFEKDVRFFVRETVDEAIARDDLETWFRADLGVEVDEENRVKRWRDLSGQGMDAIQNIARERPPYVYDGVSGASYVDFDDSEGLHLKAGYDRIANGFTATILMERNDVHAWNSSILKLESVYYARLLIDDPGAGSGVFFTSETVGFDGLLSEPFGGNVFSIITATWSPEGVAEVFVDGHRVGRSTDFRVPPDLLWLDNQLGDRFEGKLCEVALFSSSLAYPERIAVEEAMALRGGVIHPRVGRITPSLDPEIAHAGAINLDLTMMNDSRELRYTLDGSEPTSLSPIWAGNLEITRSTEVRAQAFQGEMKEGPGFHEIYRIGVSTGDGDGLLGRYFLDLDFEEQSFQRIDPQIDSYWWRIVATPEPELGSHAVSWTGEVQARYAEDYQFEVSEGELAQVWLDLNRNGTFDLGELILDTISIGGTGAVASDAVALDAGQFYALQANFQSRPGATNPLRLSWSSWSTRKQVVPQSQLYSRAENSVTLRVPAASVREGRYPNPITVDLTSLDEDVEIRYTLDGSQPTENSPLYEESILIDRDLTLRVKSFQAGRFPSPGIRVQYEIDLSRPVIIEEEWIESPFNDEMVVVREGRLRVEVETADDQATGWLILQNPETGKEVYRRQRALFDSAGTLILDPSEVPNGDYDMVIRIETDIGATFEKSQPVRVDFLRPPLSIFNAPARRAVALEQSINLSIEWLDFDKIEIYRNGVLVLIDNHHRGWTTSLRETIALDSGTNVITIVGYRGEETHEEDRTVYALPTSFYWQDWVRSRYYWTLPEGLSLEDFEPESDPDGDGLSNALELSFYRNILEPDDFELPVTCRFEKGENGKLCVIAIIHRAGATELLDFQLTYSTDLSDDHEWAEVANGDFEMASFPMPNRNFERTEFLIDADRFERSFFRVSVSPKTE
jgi:hypothetical protein